MADAAIQQNVPEAKKFINHTIFKQLQKLIEKLTNNEFYSQ